MSPERVLALLIPWVAQRSRAEELSWAASFGETGDDRANAVAVDPAGNVYGTGTFSENVVVTGEFKGSGDFDLAPSAVCFFAVDSRKNSRSSFPRDG